MTEGRTQLEQNLPGPDRSMAYLLALGTGSRVKELRSLRPESFELDDDPPTVTVHAARSQRRTTDTQPIRRDLAELVRAWLNVGESNPCYRTCDSGYTQTRHSFFGQC